MPPKPSYQPSASLLMLQLRAVLLRTIRDFFDSHNYWEVETPLLSHDIVVDLWLEPFRTAFNQSSISSAKPEELFLQTSPEFGMKRLLASGAKAIYQITRSFRNGEVGRLHNPEFSILEWYLVGADHFEQMRFVEQLVRKVFDVATTWIDDHTQDFEAIPQPLSLSSEPFKQITYDDAFLRSLDTRVLKLKTDQLLELANQQQLISPESNSPNDRESYLNRLLANCVEPKLGAVQPEFLYDYPASQAALARVRNDDPPVAERFELYIRGIEICNGYHELTDADEFQHRTIEQSERRTQAGLPPLPTENKLLSAMKAGLPPCCGVALGLDRLFMLAVGATEMSDVMAFPFDRA